MVLENKYLRKAISKAGYVVVVLYCDIETQAVKTEYISPNASALGVNVELVNKGLKLIQDYIHPEDRNKVLSTIKEAIEARIENYSHEYRMVGDNGNIYEVINDMVISDIADGGCTIECYVRDLTNKKKEKKEKKEKKRELQRLENKNNGKKYDIRATAERDKIPEIMEMFARAYSLYSAFVNVEGHTVFTPTGPATNMGDFYDLFETPQYKEYFGFILQRVNGADGAVFLDREEGGEGKLSAVPIKVNGEFKGVWILGSYTKEESDILCDIGEDQYLIANVISDYLSKSATLEIESAKSKGAGVKLRTELARQGIINDALNKINSKLIDTIDEVIDQTLRDVGIQMNVDKIAYYGYDKSQQNEFVLRNYWDVTGEAPNEDFMYELPKRKEIIEQEFINNPEIFAVDSTNVTESSKLVLMKYNLNACIFYATQKKGRLDSIIIFGVSKGERKWTAEEFRFTKSIFLLVQNMIENAEGDDNIRSVNKHLIETYNSFNIGIFVRDAGSGEILFSNKTMNEMMGKDFVGGNSKEILTDLRDRFEGITAMRKPFITQNRVANWRSYIQRFDAIMDITEIDMEWLNGEAASLILLRKAKDK